VRVRAATELVMFIVGKVDVSPGMLEGRSVALFVLQEDVPHVSESMSGVPEEIVGV